jgi:hypothetical protein
VLEKVPALKELFTKKERKKIARKRKAAGKRGEREKRERKAERGGGVWGAAR